ncbi:LOW QUALITY PROTEIN: GATOR complex protein Iml1-like [Pollicipes pollicipes]|uniref:LOW QUALITY PROTEIN: GATOR complex protein Iml1-like n=1 Tax=Pollicipes pollicipes TaxID=41117 RepID=UPI001885304E|nr:LOW QUALITY PROTEIN: GATOR complex protein Iml1-like [Pollicipes pollicipes]
MSQEVLLKLVVHQKLPQIRGESKEEIILHPCSVPGLEVGKIVEISHPDLDFARLLLQVSSGSLRDDHKVDAVSVDSTVVETFHLRDRLYDSVSVRLVDPADAALESVELLFKDHYLNRSDMWRLKNSLVGKVMYHKKNVEFCSQTVRCQVFEMWSQGDRVACGLVTPDTKVVFRSATSMFHLYIQMSEEMWDFDVYGDLYFEKAVNGFLSDLFNNWKRHGTNHEVTITLFSRLFYKANSLSEFPEYMRHDVQKDFRNMFYEDFYRVAVQNERYEDWTPVLSTIRHLFMGYREGLLNFQRERAPPGAPPPPRASLSSAAHGNFLEVLNISMNVFEMHYLHRALERTGQMCVVVSPGVGVYQVERELNNLTKQRIIDYGVGIDLVCVGEQPLHAVPLLKFHNKSLTETQDYYLPHTWINLSFYSSNKRVGYSEFVPRIKVPPSAPKAPVARVQSVLPRGRPPPSEHAIPSSVYDYDAHDADVFRMPANATYKQATMTLQRVPPRKRTVTTSHVKPPRPPTDSAVSSPIAEQVYSSSATGFVTPARASPLVQSPVSPPGELYSSSFGSVFGSDRSDGGTLRRVSFDDSDVTRSPPRPAASAVSACDLSLSRVAVPHGPGRALFNPFDPSNIVVKHTSSRRRWTHIFPKGPKGVLFQQHHYANAMGLDLSAKDAPPSSSEPTAGSPSLAFLWGASSTGEQEWSAHITTAYIVGVLVGVDWKSLTTPACLPITTDYFPDERSLQKDYLLTEYSILPDDINSPEDAGAAHRQLSTREVFTEMVSQRLCQGFQLIVSSAKPSPASGAAVGRAVFPQRVPEEREEYLLSIGRIFHRVLLSGSAINVTHYRPRHPYPVRRVSYRYRVQCHHHPSYVACEAELSTDRPESYNWNYLDNYVCTKGGSDFQLSSNLKYWRCRFLLTLVDNFIRFISAVTFALNKFKRHQPTSARQQIRERLSSNRVDQRIGARSGSRVMKGTLLSSAATAAEVVDVLRSPELGLPFLTRSVQGGLPEFTFVAADLVQWVYQHVAGVTSEQDAVRYCQYLRQENIILHASRDLTRPFVNGFCLFCVAAPADGVQLASSAAHLEQFADEWLEVETQFWWPRPVLAGARFLAAALPRQDDPFECVKMRRGALDLDVSAKSDRSEWGEIAYESSFKPDRAYQFCINWLVGTGSLISDLVVSWQRRAQNSGMRLFPVPVVMCPGSTRDIDPLRIPVHVPIQLDALRQGGRPLFHGFPPSTWRQRLLLLQSAILERFEFVRLRDAAPGPPYQYIHASGHCFAQIPEPVQTDDGDPVQDGRLQLFWRQAQAQAQLQEATPLHEP